MDLPHILQQLETVQLVRARPESEAAFSFKHSLVQQAAYESMLMEDRRALHRSIGDTIERLYGERRHEMAETLAGHFERAGDTARARDYTTVAAEQALRRFATAEAAALFAKAIQLARQEPFDPTRLLHLYQNRGRALELRGDYTPALGVYADLEALGREQAAPQLELAGIIGAASLQAVPTPLFDPVAGLANAERAVSLAQATGDPAAQARSYWLKMLVQTRIDAKGAIASGLAALDLARRHNLRELEAFTLNDIQSNYQVLGQSDRALEALEQARPIWIELDNLPMLGDNLASTAMLHVILAEYDLAVQRSREALAVSERIGNLWGQSYGRVAIALVYFARGELGPAIRETTRCIEVSEQAGFVYPQVALRAILAIAYGQVGDLQAATTLAQRVREIEKANPFHGQASGESTLAWIAVRAGNLDEAQALLQGKDTETAGIADAKLDSPVPLVVAVCAYRLAREDYGAALENADALAATFKKFQWRVLRGLLLLTRARALKGLGRMADAGVAFQAAYDEMVHQGIDAGLWEVEAELAGMAKAEGDSPVSARWIRSAAAHIRALAEGLRDLGLAERFLAQPHIGSIVEEASRLPG